MRHFEYPYNDNSFLFRHFLASVMLTPFSSAWWIGVVVSPLIILFFSVFYEVMLRKWLTIKIRKIKNYFWKKKEVKNE